MKSLAILIKVCGLLLTMIALPSLLHAQIEDPGGDVDAPIDAGLSVLIAAGIGYGIKKYRDQRKENKGKRGS